MLELRWIVLCLSCLLAVGQPAWPHSSPRWRYWTSVDGFEESYPFTVTVAPNGDILVNHGSVKEMSRLDGYRVHNLPSPDQYAAARQSRDGEIWSICWVEPRVRARGLRQYDPQSRHWVTHEINDMRSACPPFAFLPTTQSRVLYLLPDRIMLFDANTRSPVVLKEIAQTSLGEFIDMVSGRDGAIWITGRNGAARFGEKNGILASISDWTEYLFDESLGVSNLRRPCESDGGELIGTAESTTSSRDVVVRFNGESWDVLSVSNGSESLIGIPGTDGSFWVAKGERAGNLGFDHFSLSRVENGREEVLEKNKVLSGRLMAWAAERRGILWMGTTQGLARHAPSTWRTPAAVAELDKVCHAIHEDKEGRVWFACIDTLICFHDQRWKFYNLPTDLDEDNTIAPCSLPDGRLVFTIWEPEMLIFEPRVGEFEWITHPEGLAIEYVAPQKDGAVWVGTRSENGLVRLELYDGKTFKVHFEVQDGWNLECIYPFVEADNGTLWFGGPGVYDLARYRGDEYRVFDASDGHPGGASFSLLDVGNGKIWVGGRDKIIEFDGQKWTVIRSGLEFVSSMIWSSDKSIWVASGTGLHRYRDGSWVTNSREEGLPDAAAVEVFEDSRGRIWAGTTCGISLYHPETDRDAPETVIPPGGNPHESGPSGEIQFVFSGVDKWKHTESHRLLYSHRIDEGEWSTFTSDTVVSVAGLPAGQHRFEVQAMDRNWNRDPTPASFDFLVPLPWYREPGFLIILVFGGAVTLAASGYAVSRHINLEHLVSTRTRQLRALASEMSLIEERGRREIAEELHDRIGHGLAACQMQIETLQKMEHEPRTADLLKETHQMLEQATEDTRTLTFEIAPPVLYELGLEAALEWFVEDLEKEHGMQINFIDDNLPKELSKDVRGVLFRAARELLFNVLKHAGTLEARVAIQRDNNNVRLVVEDNGIGFDMAEFGETAQDRRSFGLLSIRERVEYLGGTFECRTARHWGTRVALAVPISAQREES